jgi:hypothetical protein
MVYNIFPSETIASSDDLIAREATSFRTTSVARLNEKRSSKYFYKNRTYEDVPQSVAAAEDQTLRDQLRQTELLALVLV